VAFSRFGRILSHRLTAYGLRHRYGVHHRRVPRQTLWSAKGIWNQSCCIFLKIRRPVRTDNVTLPLAPYPLARDQLRCHEASLRWSHSHCPLLACRHARNTVLIHGTCTIRPRTKKNNERNLPRWDAQEFEISNRVEHLKRKLNFSPHGTIHVTFTRQLRRSFHCHFGPVQAFLKIFLELIRLQYHSKPQLSMHRIGCTHECM
jgi:hypothetical protein